MLNTGRGAAADGRALRTQDTPRSAKVGPPRPSLPRRSVCRVLCGMLGGDPRLEPRSEPTSPTWISLQRLLLADTALLVGRPTAFPGGLELGHVAGSLLPGRDAATTQSHGVGGEILPVLTVAVELVVEHQDAVLVVGD